MTVDDNSSQDSAVIDDDLVEALGFEPVTAVVADDQFASSSPFLNGNGDDADHHDDDHHGDDHGDQDGDHEPAASPTTGSALFLEDDGFEIHDRSHNGDVEADAVDQVEADEAVEPDEFVVAEANPEVDDELATHRIEALVASMLSDSDDTEGDNGEFEVQAAMTDVDAMSKTDVVDDEHVDADDRLASDLASADAAVDEDLLDGDLDDRFDHTDVDHTDDPDHTDAADTAPDGERSEAERHGGVLDDADAGLTAPVDPVIDPATVDADLADSPMLRSDIDMFPDVAARDATVDVGLATPASVFADSPTSPPTLDQTTVVPATAVQVAGSRRLRRRRKLRARKSRRVIRHIDPWSVLTFSVLFHMCVFAALLLSSVLVWNAAIASGMVENLESFIQELGDYETFEINADVMFRAAVIVAGVLTLASSVLVVLLTVVFNLISDLVGGIRVTVIEEETVRIPVDKKRLKAETE